MLDWVKNGSAAIALAVFGAAISMIPGNTVIALYLFGAVAVLGVVAIVVGVISNRHFHRTRDGLGKFLADGDNLFYARHKTEPEFLAWKDSFEGWHSGCQTFLRERLSVAHVALFNSVPLSPRYSLGAAFSLEHEQLLHSLAAYVQNLKSILERYLTTRD